MMSDGDCVFRRDPTVRFDAKTGRFLGRYAGMGHGFPRDYVDVTPEEILYDPRRILGGYGVSATIESQGRTIVNPAYRAESTAYRSTQFTDLTPPRTQVPFIKRQSHLDLSRDSETFHISGTSDVAALGTATVISFDSFNNVRTYIRWIDVTIFDALVPTGLTFQINVEGQAKKVMATPTARVITEPSQFATSPNAIDLSQVPIDFHNVIFEVVDRRRVEVVVTNAIAADRRVQVSIWGWIEQMTRFDDAVQR